MSDNTNRHDGEYEHLGVPITRKQMAKALFLSLALFSVLVVMGAPLFYALQGWMGLDWLFVYPVLYIMAPAVRSTEVEPPHSIESQRQGERYPFWMFIFIVTPLLYLLMAVVMLIWAYAPSGQPVTPVLDFPWGLAQAVVLLAMISAMSSLFRYLHRFSRSIVIRGQNG